MCRDSSVGIVARLSVWQPKDVGSIVSRQGTFSPVSGSPAAYSVGSGGGGAGYNGRVVNLTTHLYLVPEVENEWN
jgi:hypothetical protein